MSSVGPRPTFEIASRKIATGMVPIPQNQTELRRAMDLLPSKPLIVIADDHEDSADTTAELLRIIGGYQVKVAYDGQQAVDAARLYRPSVVILDINMPVMDGLKAAALIREAQPAGAPLMLVALTARMEPSDVEMGNDASFDTYLTKPADPYDLCALIDAFALKRFNRAV